MGRRIHHREIGANIFLVSLAFERIVMPLDDVVVIRLCLIPLQTGMGAVDPAVDGNSFNPDNGVVHRDAVVGTGKTIVSDKTAGKDVVVDDEVLVLLDDAKEQ